MGDRGNRILGAALIGIGLLMLLGELGVGPLRVLWPVAVLGIGVAILADYRRRREDSGKVFTGSTLVLLAFFLMLVMYGVVPMSQHWPFFLAAPGIGLLIMARVDPRRRDAMVPGWMAIAVAAVLYFFTLGIFTGLLGLLFSVLSLLLKVVVPLGLIGGGAWLLFQQHQARRDADDAVPEKVEPDGPSWESEASSGGPAPGPPEEDAEVVDEGPDEASTAGPAQEPSETPAETPADEPRPVDPAASSPPRRTRSLRERRRRALRRQPVRRRRR